MRKLPSQRLTKTRDRAESKRVIERIRTELYWLGRFSMGDMVTQMH